MKRSISSVDGSEPDNEITEGRLLSGFDTKLLEVPFPRELEEAFAASIFELGLRSSSPKVIIPLLPDESCVNKEHIKSHLQKYRIHHQRSREEFLIYYNLNFKNYFKEWVSRKGWNGEINSAPIMNDSMGVLNKSKPFSEDGISHDFLAQKKQHAESANMGDMVEEYNLSYSDPSAQDINDNFLANRANKQQSTVSVSTSHLISQAEGIVVDWKNQISQCFSQVDATYSSLKTFVSQIDGSFNDVRILCCFLIV